LLRHPDRDLQAVFVDSRTFVRPLSKTRQRDSRQPTVILQGAYNKLTKTEKDMYHQVGPVKRRVEVDIEDFLGFIEEFKAYLKSYEMNGGKMSKSTNNQMKKMIMDFDYSYTRDEIPPQYYTDRDDPNKAYGQKLTRDHTRYYQEAHRLARLINHKNNWDVPYPDEENKPFLKELSDLDNSTPKTQEYGSNDHVSDPHHEMKALLFELTMLAKCTKAQQHAKNGDDGKFPRGSDARDENQPPPDDWDGDPNAPDEGGDGIRGRQAQRKYNNNFQAPGPLNRRGQPK
jgi:hypothetical protein